MTATQVIEEIIRLPKTEQERVFAFFAANNNPGASEAIRYMDRQKAKMIGEELFREHPELFRKLAQ